MLPFTESDVSILEAFAIFCGLGIHNTQMYESACKLMAKQKVALECLSYHATATQSQTEDLIKDHIPSAEAYTLYSFTFNGEDDELQCKVTSSKLTTYPPQTLSLATKTRVGRQFECFCSAIWCNSFTFRTM